ncbi:MAG: hypothetical protein HY889_08480 [Deltaproteobacteria bacterium]|nr:hypothetical protein [Deltaproteobacteria bacterium]
MKSRGVVVIDLMGEADELEKGEIKREDHACRCEVCHCDNGVPKGYEGRAVKYDESLILLPQAYVELRGRWNSR